MAKNQRSKSKVAKTRRLPPDQYLRRQKHKRRFAFIAGIIFLSVLSLLDRAGQLNHQSSDMQRYHHRLFRVVRVIDGDTIRIQAADGNSPTTSVRLWGVDTAEIAKPYQGIAAEPFSEEAKQLTIALCQNQQVQLILEPHRQRGYYGRLLAYVQLPDGQILNEQLILAGLSAAEQRFVHHQLKRYTLLEQQARHDRVGMWATPQKH